MFKIYTKTYKKTYALILILSFSLIFCINVKSVFASDYSDFTYQLYTPYGEQIENETAIVGGWTEGIGIANDYIYNFYTYEDGGNDLYFVVDYADLSGIPSLSWDRETNTDEVIEKNGGLWDVYGGTFDEGYYYLGYPKALYHDFRRITLNGDTLTWGAHDRTFGETAGYVYSGDVEYDPNQNGHKHTINNMYSVTSYYQVVIDKGNLAGAQYSSETFGAPYYTFDSDAYIRTYPSIDYYNSSALFGVWYDGSYSPSRLYSRIYNVTGTARAVFDIDQTSNILLSDDIEGANAYSMVTNEDRNRAYILYREESTSYIYCLMVWGDEYENQNLRLVDSSGLVSGNNSRVAIAYQDYGVYDVLYCFYVQTYGGDSFLSVRALHSYYGYLTERLVLKEIDDLDIVRISSSKEITDTDLTNEFHALQILYESATNVYKLDVLLWRPALAGEYWGYPFYSEPFDIWAYIPFLLGVIGFIMFCIAPTVAYYGIKNNNWYEAVTTSILLFLIGIALIIAWLWG